MSNINTVTLNGNPTRAPEKYAFPNSEDWVVKLGLAHTPRYFDKQQNQYVDGKTSFVDVEIKGGTANADNVLALVNTKTKIVVTGELSVEQYDKRDGTTGVSVRIKNARVEPDWSVRQHGVENSRGGQQRDGFGGPKQHSGYDRGFPAEHGPSGERGPAAQDFGAAPESDRWAQPTGGYNWDTARPGGNY